MSTPSLSGHFSVRVAPDGHHLAFASSHARHIIQLQVTALGLFAMRHGGNESSVIDLGLPLIRDG